MLARLAVDQGWQGKGFGRALFRDAARRSPRVNAVRLDRFCRRNQANQAISWEERSEILDIMRCVYPLWMLATSNPFLYLVSEVGLKLAGSL